ncbi:FHA domain-containing protein [Yoonia algicola]|uniref:FHA domain-containing protein n=1 Tax=Yoonia algicola TaxID=3137368 RepID=A0AAN0M2M0_9RHOB
MSNDKTKWIFDDSSESIADTGKTVTSPEMTETLDNQHFGAGNSEPTVHIGGGGATQPESEKTQIYTGASAEAGFADQSDPVTGWLVVVKGPGLGQSVPLGSGMNTVGRGVGARASLPFGDTLISSEDHLRIIYDDAERTFFVSHGSGKNISRVNGQLLANTLPLTTDSVIELSKSTRVVFKQFCSQDFDWSDLEQGADKA